MNENEYFSNLLQIFAEANEEEEEFYQKLMDESYLDVMDDFYLT